MSQPDLALPRFMILPYYFIQLGPIYGRQNWKVGTRTFYNLPNADAETTPGTERANLGTTAPHAGTGH